MIHTISIETDSGDRQAELNDADCDEALGKQGDMIVSNWSLNRVPMITHVLVQCMHCEELSGSGRRERKQE